MNEPGPRAEPEQGDTPDSRDKHRPITGRIGNEPGWVCVTCDEYGLRRRSYMRTRRHLTRQRDDALDQIAARSGGRLKDDNAAASHADQSGPRPEHEVTITERGSHARAIDHDHEERSASHEHRRATGSPGPLGAIWQVAGRSGLHPLIREDAPDQDIA